MLYLSIAAVVIILAIAYKNELKSFFGELKSRKKEVSAFRSAVNDSKNNNKGISFCFCVIAVVISFILGTLFGIFAFEAKPESKLESKPKLNDAKLPLKEVVLTVSNTGEGNDGCKYVKFSDGHTIRADVGSQDYTKWVFLEKGDKVRKLIYANKEPEYTPEFDDKINKNSIGK